MKKFKLGKSKSKSKSSEDDPNSLGLKKPAGSSHPTRRSSSSTNSTASMDGSARNVDDLLEKWERNNGQEEPEDDDDVNNNEPKQEIFMGTRRLTLTNIEKIKGQMKELHMKDGKYIPTISEDGGSGSGGGGKMPASSAGKMPAAEYQRPSTSSVSNNVLCNIHSSPLDEFDITYQPPVYPKSQEEQEFISLSLQRNFVFANALSDDEIVRKREMKQVVDAFEYHAVTYSGEMIMNHKDAGDYFYILKEGSVRYYAKYRPSGVKDELGSGKCIGMANKPGQSFGELCLLYDCPPPADCVSSGDPSETECMCEDGVSACSFWRIHKSTFRQILALRSMRRDVRLREALQKVDVLQELDVEYLKKIADALHARNAEKGEILFEEGGICDRFYLKYL